MASTPSPILRIQLMGTGDQAGTWGDTTNTNLGTLLEGAIAGRASVSVTSANQAFTVSDYVTDQARMAIISLSTTTAANFSVYAPPVSKTYTIQNTSSYDATIYNSTVAGNTTAAGSGVTIPAGKVMQVWSNGADFYKALTTVSLTADVTGTLPVANGGTGATTLTGVVKGNGASAFTASNVSLTTEVTGTLPVGNGGTGATTFSSGQFLKGAGTSAVTTSATVALGSEVSGTLPVANGGTGTTSLTANNVILGNGTSAVQVVAPGTNGNVLTSNGTTWTSAAPVLYAGPTATVYSSSGTSTFTVPTGVTKLFVQVWGGGGGGGGGSTSGAYGGVGGVGGLGTAYISGLTPGASITVTVGGGGNGGNGSSGGTGASGTSGGTSSFGSYLSCTGGSGGTGGTGSGSAGAAGAAGSPTFSGATIVARNIDSVFGGGASGTHDFGGYTGGGGGGGLSSGGGGGGGFGTNGTAGAIYGPGASGANGSTSGGVGGGTGGGTGGANSGAGGGGGGGCGGVVVWY